MRVVQSVEAIDEGDSGIFCDLGFNMFAKGSGSEDTEVLSFRFTM